MVTQTKKDKDEAKAAKERAKPRTIDEQIAALEAKKAASEKRRHTKAKKDLDDVETSIVSAEARLLGLLDKRSDLRATLGWTEDENGSVTVPPSTDEPATDETPADS